MARPVVVIGAGLGGLSAACRLAGSGHEVTVLEAGSGPGGRAGQLQLGDYRFDTGPTVLTMPHIVEDCFQAAGAHMADFVELVPVDPMYRACFADGSELRVRHGHEAMRAEIASVCGAREATRSTSSSTGSVGSTPSKCRRSSPGTTTRRSTSCGHCVRRSNWRGWEGSAA